MQGISTIVVHLMPTMNQDSFQEIIRSEWENWEKNKPYFHNFLNWWDRGKTQLKKAVITFSAEAAKKRNSERKRLLRELNELQNQLDSGDTACVDKFNETRSNFLELTKNNPGSVSRELSRPKIKGEIVDFLLTDKDPDAKRMQSLRGRDGRVTADPLEMSASCHQFYKDLYTAVPVDQTNIEFFLNVIDKSLSPDESLLLEGPVTLSEVREALFGMEAGKSPGSDGLPAEFYKTFFSV